MTAQPSSSAALRSKNRQLDRAVQHVSSLWIPVQPEILQRIQTGLSEGTYDLDIDFLIDEIKSDLALLCHCLRELGSEAAPDANLHSPTELLRNAGVERLRAVLSVQPGSLSRHSIADSSGDQIARLQEALISASAAQTLGEAKGQNGDTLFTTALLRQLGLILIAWNYPSTYKRALQSAAEGEQLEETLDRALGFSPQLLAAALLQEWSGLPAEVRFAAGGRAALTEAELPIANRIQSDATPLIKVCGLGESLARACDPEHYPDARMSWEKLKGEIVSVLGPDGLNVIQERLQKNSERYTKLFPSQFDSRPVVEVDGRLHAHRKRQLLRSNPYLDQCTPVLRKRLADIYERISGREGARQAIELIVREVIPVAGFCGGSVYTFDPSSNKLVPRLRIGKVELRVLTPVPIGESSDQNPLAAAFECATPLLFRGRTSSGEALSYIAGGLGAAQRMGVLYLEFPPFSPQHGAAVNHLTHFKAIVQAFNDCIKAR